MEKITSGNVSCCRHVLFSNLCNFISGVPFDREKDLGKYLRDFHAVVPARKAKQHLLMFLPQYMKVFLI